MSRPISLKLELKIRNPAALNLAFDLWNNPIIQAEIEKYGPDIYIVEGQDSLPNQIKFAVITNELMKLIPSLNLPPESVTELEAMIMFTQDKVFHWLVYIVSKGTISFKQGLNFFWKPYGIIDEYKIYEKFKRDIRFNQIGFDGRDSRERKLVLYCLACAYGEVKFVKHCLKEFAELMGNAVSSVIKDFNKEKVSLNTAMTMAMIWLKSDGYLEEFTVFYSGLKNSTYKAGTDKMFAYSLTAGYKNAAEYFYKKLNEDDLPRILNQVGLELLVNATVMAVNYEQHRIPDLLLYIMGKMSEEQKRTFILKNVVKVYSVFLKTWPYQELCIDILDYFTDDLNLSVRSSIFEKTSNFFNYFLGTECADAHNTAYLPLLENILKKVPGKVKLNYIRKNDYISKMFHNYNLLVIKMMVDDPDLIKHRSELIDISESLPEYLSRGKKPRRIVEYMEYLNFSMEEKKPMLEIFEDLDILEELISEGDFETAEKVLKWQSELNGKVNEYKSNLNTEDMCLSLIRSSKCYLIDDLLKWQFNSDEEKVERARKKLSSINSICEAIWIIWIKRFEHGDNLDSTRNNCLKFIRYIFKTVDELKSFKESILRNQKFLHVLFHDKVSFYNYSCIAKFVIPIMDVICQSFLLSSNEIVELKNTLKNDINAWFNSYNWKFEIFNSLINWVSDTDEEKKNLITKILSSNKRLTICCEILKSGVGPNSNPYSDRARDCFLKQWVKPYGFACKIKNSILESNKKIDIDTEINLIRISKLLDDLSLEC